jgi:hypothetical protein
MKAVMMTKTMAIPNHLLETLPAASRGWSDQVPCARGSVRVTVVPCSGTLVSASRPPCATAMLRTMESPRPVPLFATELKELGSLTLRKSAAFLHGGAA